MSETPDNLHDPQPPATLGTPLPIGEMKAPKPALGGLIDLLAFLIAAVGLTFLVSMLAALVVALDARQAAPDKELAKHFAEVVKRLSEDAFLLVPVQLVVYIFIIGLVYLFVRVVRGLPFAESLGLGGVTFRHTVLVFFGGIALAITVNLASLLFPPPENVGFENFMVSQTAALWILALAILAAPVTEEIVFRGYIFTLVEKRWNPTAAIVTSGLIFGSIHFPQLWPGVPQMLLLCVVGVSFSAVRARTGSTTATIIMHFSYNATLSAGMLLSEEFWKLPATIF